MKSWVKGVLLLLTGLVLVAAALAIRVYMNTPKPQTVVLTPPPTPSDVLTVEGLHPPTVKPEWVEKMQAYEARAHWLDTPTWLTETIQINGKSHTREFWQVPFVSTGIWGKGGATLRDGQQFGVDVLYALQFTATREVLLIPIVMGTSYQSDYFVWVGNYPQSSRENFLKRARDDYPLGQVIMAFAEKPWATVQGIDWVHCNAGKAQIPKWACELGNAIESQWPDYTGLVLRRVLPASSLPDSFVLYGVMPQALSTETWEVSP